jgi:16S rRNA (uracil1498-N3)-methyltransferase
VAPILALADWLPQAGDGTRWLLSLQPDARSAAQLGMPPRALITLSGPEGGLGAAEEAAAREHGFVAVALGSRVLRAETAPLAVLAWLGLAQAR